VRVVGEEGIRCEGDAAVVLAGGSGREVDIDFASLVGDQRLVLPPLNNVSVMVTFTWLPSSTTLLKQ
jgi:hypothetical protein